MRKYALIGCGGFAGAILRYLLDQIKQTDYHGNIPLNTLVINLSGAFLMGFLLTAALEFWTADADLRAGMTTGLLGAYTTFSTMCKEASALFLQGNPLPALFYLAASVSLGLAAIHLGAVSARLIRARYFPPENPGISGEEDPEVD